MTSKTSVFGLPQYSPIEVLNDDRLKPVLQSALKTICEELKLSENEARFLASELWVAERPRTVLEFEERLQGIVSSVVSPQIMRQALEKRSQLITEQIAPYVIGDSLLDIGCGDGLVAWNLRERFYQILLIDVHDYLAPEVNLPMLDYCDGQSLPIDHAFDTCLLLTVLHHAENPDELLRETRRVCRQRAIVIESIYGVLPASTGIPEMSLLNNELQRMYATFIDWLYNRVFHDGVPVPYNFNTPSGWCQLFMTTGWSIIKEADLGIDQPLVPEYHFLFVLEPKDD